MVPSPHHCNLSANSVASSCSSSPRLKSIPGDMLQYVDNIIFIPIFVCFSCVVLCSLNYITVSTVHLKLLITAVEAQHSCKNCFMIRIQECVCSICWLFCSPDMLGFYHITCPCVYWNCSLTCFHYSYLTATEGQGVGSVLHWLLMDYRGVWRTQILWEELVKKQFRHWLDVLTHWKV